MPCRAHVGTPARCKRSPSHRAPFRTPGRLSSLASARSRPGLGDTDDLRSAAHQSTAAARRAASPQGGRAAQAGSAARLDERPSSRRSRRPAASAREGDRPIVGTGGEDERARLDLGGPTVVEHRQDAIGKDPPDFGSAPRSPEAGRARPAASGSRPGRPQPVASFRAQAEGKLPIDLTAELCPLVHEQHSCPAVNRLDRRRRPRSRHHHHRVEGRHCAISRTGQARSASRPPCRGGRAPGAS